MRLNNQLASSRRRRIAARARTVQAKPVKHVVIEQAKPVELAIERSQRASGTERRNFSRVSTDCEIVVRRIGGFNFEVAMRDVSVRGCQVDLLEACEVGDAIITRFPQLEPLGSHVCWTRGTTTGIEFHTKIHPAVFDHLLGRLNQANAAA